MVLPERIGLSTSPLPRECSTTELRQLFLLLRPNRLANYHSHATGLALLQLPWQYELMEKTESPKTLPQREADRRKRQAAALKANLKRRKILVATETEGKTPKNPS
jgi:hypothetical protein